MLVPTAITSITQNLPVLPFLTGSMGGIAITAVQLLGTFTSYGNEANPTTRTQYSKFVVKDDGGREKVKTKPKKMVKSETGMTLIYAPAFLVSVVMAVGGSSLSIVPPPTWAGVLCLLHFAKRCAEVKFLHHYSGTIELATAVFIGTYYTLIAVLIANIATTTPTPLSITIGTTVFAMGLLGNFYHHSLLAKLRNKKNNGPTRSGRTTTTTQHYVAPQGGLFRYVAAPHYLFELLGWLGIAIVSQHGNAYLVLASMGSYLTGRAVAQNAWNRAKFTDQHWPSTRKNIVPFVF